LVGSGEVSPPKTKKETKPVWDFMGRVGRRKASWIKSKKKKGCGGGGVGGGGGWGGGGWGGVGGEKNGGFPASSYDRTRRKKNCFGRKKLPPRKRKLPQKKGTGPRQNQTIVDRER